MDGDEQVGALLVGEVGSFAQRHEDIRAAAECDLDAQALLDEPRDARRHVEHHVLLPHTARTGGAGIVTAVPRIQDDQAERLHGRRALLAAGGLPGAVDIQDDAKRVLKGRGLDLAGRAFQRHLEHGVGAGGLEADLSHEPVGDLLGPRAGDEEAGQPHADLLPARHDGKRQRACRLDHDAREGGVGAIAQLREGNGRLDGLGRRRLDLRDERDGGGAGSQPRQTLREEFLGNEPAGGADPGGRVEGQRLAGDDDPRLVAHELGGTLADHQRGLPVLDAPGTAEERGQTRGRDIDGAVVHHDAR